MIALTYITVTLKQFRSAMHTIKGGLYVKMNTMMNRGNFATLVENQVIIIVSDIIADDIIIGPFL